MFNCLKSLGLQTTQMQFIQIQQRLIYPQPQLRVVPIWATASGSAVGSVEFDDTK